MGGAASNILRMPEISTWRTRSATTGPRDGTPLLSVGGVANSPSSGATPFVDGVARSGRPRDAPEREPPGDTSAFTRTAPFAPGGNFAVPVIVVVGAQFGDEAKGKIADYLAANATFVVRTGGGPNAGHTIEVPEGKVVLHQLPCGVLRHGVTAVCGQGMVLDPTALDEEIRTLQERRMFQGSLVVSERAHAILPTHIAEDAWEEKVRTAAHPGAELGTTRRGIGPAYADRYGRWGSGSAN